MQQTDWMFPAATLGPAALLLLAALFGGPLIVLAFLSMTFLAFALDLLIARSGGARDVAFPAADLLSQLIVASHFVLLGAGLIGLAGPWLSPVEKAGLFLGLGLWFGQVSNANAHELIHRTDKRLFRMGKWVYISLLFGHHTSAHPKVHHRFVGTYHDPNTALLGESVYGFLRRAWGQSFRAGWEVEQSQLQMRYGRKGARWRHPYTVYIGGALGFVLLALLLGGWSGAAAYLALAGFAQMQLLVSDYVQHYGLEREVFPGGQLAPVGPEHSWNAPHAWSSRMMLHAPRHSDHHAQPTKPYPALDLPAPQEAPRLPSSLPVMALVAFVPPLWFRLMTPRAKAWHAQTASWRAAA